MSCKKCGSENELITLSKDFEYVELCKYCFTQFHHKLERRRTEHIQKNKKVEKRLLRKYLKRANDGNPEIIGALFTFIVVVIIVLIIIYRAKTHW